MFDVQEILVVRKVHPCLPSFKAEFTASVPLTRIRDIAHRNDIPHDLKVYFAGHLVHLFTGQCYTPGFFSSSRDFPSQLA